MDRPGLYRLIMLQNLYDHRPETRRDPFLVAVIISMAQKQRRKTPKPEPRSLDFEVLNASRPQLPCLDRNANSTNSSLDLLALPRLMVANDPRYLPNSHPH